jgi:hypothetical protein
MGKQSIQISDPRALVLWAAESWVGTDRSFEQFSRLVVNQGWISRLPVLRNSHRVVKDPEHAKEFAIKVERLGLAPNRVLTNLYERRVLDEPSSHETTLSPGVWLQLRRRLALFAEERLSSQALFQAFGGVGPEIIFAADAFKSYSDNLTAGTTPERIQLLRNTINDKFSVTDSAALSLVLEGLIHLIEFPCGQAEDAVTRLSWLCPFRPDQVFRRVATHNSFELLRAVERAARIRALRTEGLLGAAVNYLNGTADSRCSLPFLRLARTIASVSPSGSDPVQWAKSALEAGSPRIRQAAIFNLISASAHDSEGAAERLSTLQATRSSYPKTEFLFDWLTDGFVDQLRKNNCDLYHLGDGHDWPCPPPGVEMFDFSPEFPVAIRPRDEWLRQFKKIVLTAICDPVESRTRSARAALAASSPPVKAALSAVVASQLQSQDATAEQALMLIRSAPLPEARHAVAVTISASSTPEYLRSAAMRTAGDLYWRFGLSKLTFAVADAIVDQASSTHSDGPHQLFVP